MRMHGGTPRWGGGSGGGFWATLRAHVPPATLYVLVINVCVFLAMAIVPPVSDVLARWGAAVPPLIARGQVWRLITYQFLHADAMHLLFNMLTLYFFGPLVEQTMGTRRFSAYYLACGAGAGLLHTLVKVLASRSGLEIMVGASGSLYGVLFAAAYFFPNQTVYLNFLFPMKMKHMVWIFGGLAFLGSMGGSGGGISHITHLGGLLVGILLLMGPGWWERLRGGGGRGSGGGKGRGRGRVETLYDDPHWRMDQ